MTEKKFICAILSDSILVFAQSDDRGYAHLRFAGAFAVVERQGECGSKTCQLHVSQPMTYRASVTS